jgi:hypothetical protein
MKKTLVIHPQDPTTEFLCGIYKGLGFDEKRTNFNWLSILLLIPKYNRIILLGHGSPKGLAHYSSTIIDKTHYSVLQGREVIAIWCHAKSYMEEFGLHGFYTDMFISAVLEAKHFNVPATQNQIDESNQLFVQLVRKNLDSPNRLKQILIGYQSEQNQVIKFNNQRLFDNAA